MDSTRGRPRPAGKVAVRYVEEALRAFNARCYLARSVMLGVASERAVNDLGHALAAALGSKATKPSRLLTSPISQLAAQLNEMRKLLVQVEFSPTPSPSMLWPIYCESTVTTLAIPPAPPSTKTPPTPLRKSVSTRR
ncbi:MAG: hypothetical protein QOG75_2714 [Mycobacterium sp.]|nr:hypothetical protein [Mycobacterium sp.]